MAADRQQVHQTNWAGIWPGSQGRKDRLHEALEEATVQDRCDHEWVLIQPGDDYCPKCGAWR